MPEPGNRRRAREPEEIKKDLRELADFLATTEFCEAMQRLMDHPEEASEAQSDGREYLRKRNVRVPSQVKVTVEGNPRFHFFNSDGTLCLQVFVP